MLIKTHTLHADHNNCATENSKNLCDIRKFLKLIGRVLQQSFYKSIPQWSWLLGESMLHVPLTKKDINFQKTRDPLPNNKVLLCQTVSDKPEYTQKCFCFTFISSG